MAKPVEQPGQKPVHTLEKWGGIAFVVLIFMVGSIIIATQPRPTQKITPPEVKITSTPQSYNDFIGKVTATDAANLTVDFYGTNSSGKPFTKSFRITTNSSTELQTISTVANQRILTALKLSDIKVGNTVFASSPINIAPLSEFTATKIYLYQPTS